MYERDSGAVGNGNTFTTPSKNWFSEYIGPDGTVYNMNNTADRNYVFENFVLNGADPEYARFINEAGLGRTEQYKNWLREREAYANAQDSGDWLGYQKTIADQGIDLSAEQEAYMNNMISQQNTLQNQQFETQSRDSSLLSAGSQLQQLGLSPSNVIQTGGVGVNGVSTALTNHSNAANLRQQRRLNDYNQKMGIAKSLIGMAGSMASSGIYGSAIGAARHAASALSEATAHSALNVLKNSSHPQNLINQLAKNGNNYMFDKLGLG